MKFKIMTNRFFYAAIHQYHPMHWYLVGKVCNDSHSKICDFATKVGDLINYPTFPAAFNLLKSFFVTIC